MTAATLSIFDAYGKLRLDFSSEEIASISEGEHAESRLTRFHTLVVAAQESEAAEAAYQKNEDAIKAALKYATECVEAKNKEHPAPTFHSEWIRMFGSDEQKASLKSGGRG